MKRLLMSLILSFVLTGQSYAQGRDALNRIPTGTRILFTRGIAVPARDSAYFQGGQQYPYETLDRSQPFCSVSAETDKVLLRQESVVRANRVLQVADITSQRFSLKKTEVVRILLRPTQATGVDIVFTCVKHTEVPNQIAIATVSEFRSVFKGILELEFPTPLEL